MISLTNPRPLSNGNNWADWSGNGVLLLNKPKGISSNRALQQVKRMFSAVNQHLPGKLKAGHTGSLDPLATGMLPICFGKATKLATKLLNTDKQYLVTAKLGEKTSTGDTEGEIISRKAVLEFDQEDLLKVCQQFSGESQQIPPMYSAVKHKGKPLYAWARQGITIERAAKTINIYSLELGVFTQQQIDFKVHCSKGTYIRTLIEDIGESLGCGAHVIKLHRLTVGNYQAAQMISMDQLPQLIADGHWQDWLLPAG